LDAGFDFDHEIAVFHSDVFDDELELVARQYRTDEQNIVAAVLVLETFSDISLKEDNLRSNMTLSNDGLDILPSGGAGPRHMSNRTRKRSEVGEVGVDMNGIEIVSALEDGSSDAKIVGVLNTLARA
jgi:hypothetical protein